MRLRDRGQPRRVSLLVFRGRSQAGSNSLPIDHYRSCHSTAWVEIPYSICSLKGAHRYACVTAGPDAFETSQSTPGTGQELSIRLTTSSGLLQHVFIRKVSRSAQPRGLAPPFDLSIRLTRGLRFARPAMILASESSALEPRSEPILNA